jgi:hypothetical protein
MSYRTPHARGPQVVTYWTSRGWTRWLGVVLSSAAYLTVVLFVVINARDIAHPNLYRAVWIVGWLPVLLLSLLGFTHARVEVDRAAQTLTVHRRVWPLRRTKRTFALSRVKDAIVIAPDWADGGDHVALVIDGEKEPFPLIDELAWHSKDHERTATQIRALLDEIETTP